MVNAQVGVLRGYLANAAKVRVRGIEFDGTAKVNDNSRSIPHCLHRRRVRLLPGRAASARGNRRTAIEDISGSVLPGISTGRFPSVVSSRLRRAFSDWMEASSRGWTTAIGPSFRRARPLPSTWSLPPTSSSTLNSAFAPTTAGRRICGGATYSTRSTSSSSRRRRATRVSMSGCPAIPGPSA